MGDFTCVSHPRSISRSGEIAYLQHPCWQFHQLCVAFGQSMMVNKISHPNKRTWKTCVSFHICAPNVYTTWSDNKPMKCEYSHGNPKDDVITACCRLNVMAWNHISRIIRVTRPRHTFAVPPPTSAIYSVRDRFLCNICWMEVSFSWLLWPHNGNLLPQCTVIA
jgi:hypothetical protein